MTRTVSRTAIVVAIVRKDLVEWSRDLFWVLISAMVLVAFGILFWVMPNTVDETIYVGVHPQILGDMFTQAAAVEDDAPGVVVVGYDSVQELIVSIEDERTIHVNGDDHELRIGIVFPQDFLSGSMVGETSTVSVYVHNTVPEEVSNAMSALVRELAYGARVLALGGNPEAALPVTFSEQETMILGPDHAGDQTPFKEQMRPMIAFIMLLMESLALAALIAVEIQSKTVTALIVTPARSADVLLAKSITGTLLALSQVLLILAITDAFADGNVVALLLAALVGALMATAVGMLTGAAGKDFMGTLFYGLLFLIPFSIPTLAALLPGSASWFVKVIPSWGVVHTMATATAGEMRWGDVVTPLAYAAAWSLALLAVGWLQLERKLQTL